MVERCIALVSGCDYVAPMAADWSALTAFLRSQPETVTLTWGELEHVVGEIPRSAISHPEWWGGDRSHTRAWRAAGFRVLTKEPGLSVTFHRIGSSTHDPSTSPLTHESTAVAEAEPCDRSGRLLLITCGKSKRTSPAAAKDLYLSPRFRKARTYAERSGSPWFILSAEHALVGPDEWIAPYDRYLPDTPRDYRVAWGEWAAARLELLAGPLHGRVIEIHAGAAYVQPLTTPLARRGAQIERPLEGLTSVRWQGWYDARAGDQPADVRGGGDEYPGDPEAWIAQIGDHANSVSPSDLASIERSVMDGPGLYGWFVDQLGAADISRGLGIEVSAGLIYVGQTGATKWPSGKASTGTLLNRIRRQHLGGSRSSSTLRRTLGAILDQAHEHAWSSAALSDWMVRHLRVVPAITPDADALGDLERQVVRALDPPLNLDHVDPTPTRTRLQELRAATDQSLR